MFCTECGSKIPDDANFCTNCGKKIIRNSPPTKEEPPRTITAPSSVDGHKVAYHYEDVKIYVDDSSAANIGLLTLGEQIKFTAEPSNQYDPNAVAIFTEDNTKIGYLYKSRMQDMVHDFQKKQLPILAYVTCLNSEEKIVELFIVFYCNKERPANFSKTYRLTGNANSEMQETISLSSVGEEVEYDYDYEKEKYLASAGGDIGYFPKSADSLLEDSPRAYISDISENDSGKYVVSVGVEE